MLANNHVTIQNLRGNYFEAKTLNSKKKKFKGGVNIYLLEETLQ